MLNSRTILVVDENRDAARSLTLLLERLGHSVRAYYDGHAAIEAARQLRPDVVFLDLYMPHPDGFEVARRLRMEPGFGRMLIFAVTGSSTEEDRQRSQDAGIDHYIVKPVDLAFVTSLLGRHR